MKIEKLLTDYFCQYYNINTELGYEIEMIDSKELLVPERLDLIAKLIWLEHKNKGYNLEFANSLYKKHLEVMTNGTYIEGGKEEKNSVSKYLEVFNELQMRLIHGFDENESAIPVGRSNAIMDGAHRTAISILHNLKIPIIKFQHLQANNNAEFFKERLMDENLIDYMVTDYCKRKEQVYAICIWPKGESKQIRQQAEELIKSNSKMIYKKEITLSQRAMRNLMIQIYYRHEWMGGASSRFKGASNKSEACWCPNNSTIVYFVEGPELSDILKLKQNIRDLFGVGNHSIHITDNRLETVQIANIILNENSLDLIDRGRPDAYVKLNLLVEEFKQKVLSSGGSLDDYIIDSSGVLGLYGIRRIEDLDYLSIDKREIQFNNKSIEEHHSYLSYHKKNLEELLYNPKNYLVFNEVKFVSLECAKNFKANRNEKKDIEDIRLINEFNSNNFNLKEFYFKQKLATRRFIRNIKSRVKFFLKRFPLLYALVRKLKTH